MPTPLTVTAARMEGEYLVLSYPMPDQYVEGGRSGAGHEHWMPLAQIVQQRAALYNLDSTTAAITEVIWERLAEKMTGNTTRVPGSAERRAAESAFPITGLAAALTRAKIVLPALDPQRVAQHRAELQSAFPASDLARVRGAAQPGG